MTVTIYLVALGLLVVGSIVSGIYFSYYFKNMPRNILLIQSKLGNTDDPIGNVIPYMKLRNSWDMIDEE